MTRAHRIGAQTGLAVFIVLFFSFYLNIYNSYWAIITILILSINDASEVFLKAVARILGTVLGAGLGIFLVMLISDHHLLFCVLLCLIPFLGVYQSRESRYAYAWVLGSLTAYIILISSVVSAYEVYYIAAVRALEILIGSLTLMVTHHLFHRSIEIEKNEVSVVEAKDLVQVRKDALKIALSGGLTFYFWVHTGWVASINGIVTAYIISSQPNHRTTLPRAIVRLFGFFVGAALGLVLMRFIHSAAVLVILLSIIAYIFTWVGAHYVRYKYYFLQVIAAIAITLVSPDNIITTDISVVFERLFGMFLGITCTIAVFFLVWLISEIETKRVDHSS